MRLIIALCLSLAACSQNLADPGPEPGTFAGEGRDRLCIAGESGALRAGLIAFGKGDVNCSASGKLEKAGQDWLLVPKGEGDCRIPLEIGTGIVRVGQLSAACSYYCGGGASMDNKSFSRNASASNAVDLAGDPLC